MIERTNVPQPSSQPQPSSIVRQRHAVGLEALEKGRQHIPVVPPSADGSVVESLANLHQAGRANDPTRGLELEARRIPVQPQEVEHAPRGLLKIRYEALVVNFQTWQRVDAAPVL